MPQNPEYLKKVFEAIDGEAKGYNYDNFVSAMASNEDYNKRVFEAIGGPEKGYSYDNFKVATGFSQKKSGGEESVSAGPSTSQPSASPDGMFAGGIGMGTVGFGVSDVGGTESPSARPEIGQERATPMGLERPAQLALNRQQPLPQIPGMPTVTTRQPQQPQQVFVGAETTPVQKTVIARTPAARNLLAEYTPDQVEYVAEQPQVEFKNGKKVYSGGRFFINDEVGFVEAENIKGDIEAIFERTFAEGKPVTDVRDTEFTLDDFNKMSENDIASLLIDGNDKMVEYVTSLMREGRREGEFGGIFDDENIDIAKRNEAIDRAFQISREVTRSLSAYVPQAVQQLDADLNEVTKQVELNKAQLKTALYYRQITQAQYDEEMAKLDKFVEDIMGSEMVVRTRRADNTFKALAATGALYDMSLSGESTAGKGIVNAMLDGLNSVVQGGVRVATSADVLALRWMNMLADGAGFDPVFSEEYLSGLEAAGDYLTDKADLNLAERVGFLSQNERAYLEGLNPTQKLLYQSATGLGGSLPAMAIPYGLGFFAQAYGGAYDDAIDRGLTSTEATLYASSVGMVVSALEKYGLSNLVKSSPIIAKLAGTSLRQMRGARGDVIRALDAAVNRNVKGFALTYGKRLGAGFLSEAETGGLQALAESGMKIAVNELKDRQIFSTEDINLSGSSILEAAVLEGLGGLYMSSVHGLIAGRERHNWSGFSDKQMQVFRASLKDGSMLEEQYLGYLNQLYQNKQITAQEYQKRIVNFNAAKRVFATIPTEYSDRDAAEAADLIQQKEGLEAQMATLTGAAAKRYQEAIDQINTRLEEIDKKYAGTTPGQRPPTAPPAAPPTPPTTPPTTPPAAPPTAPPAGPTPPPTQTTQDAEEQQGQPMRPESPEAGQEQGVSDSDMPVVDEAVVQDGAQAEEVTPIVRPTRADKTAFDDGTLDPNRLDGILQAIANKQATGKKLTKFQEDVAAKHADRLEEMKTPPSMGTAAREELTQPVPSEEAAAEAPSVGATAGEVKLEYQQTDSKGRTYTYYSNTSESDGVTTTSFTFNRSDKDAASRNKSFTGIPVEQAFGDKYEVSEDQMPDGGAKVAGVSEIREGAQGVAATVTFELPNGRKFRGEVKLSPKSPTMETAAPEQPLRKAKNVKDLEKINKEVFGLKPEKAKADATIMDIMIGVMAERDGITKEEAYDRLSFGTTTMEQLSERGKALFQLIGENAQMTDDVVAFLEQAKSMEEAGATPLEIRRQTNWERGADGKWRYELMDGDWIDGPAKKLDEAYAAVKEYNKALAQKTAFDKGDRTIVQSIGALFGGSDNADINTSARLNDRLQRAKEALPEGVVINPRTGDAEVLIKGKLSDFFYSKELFEAYPQLMDINITIKSDSEAQEGKDDNGEYNPTSNEIEINARNKNSRGIVIHEIQHAIQGLENFAIGGSPEYVKQMVSSALELLKNQINTTKQAYSIIEKYKGLQGYYKDFIDKKYKKLLDDYNDLLKKSKGKVIEPSSYKLYRKLAGEVEAFNTSIRLNMTPEQRRETLLRDTEDVARDEQLVLFEPATQESAMPPGVLFQIDAMHGSPYLFDKFLTEKIGTGEGAQAFGWGLYFTDIEGIARHYAETLGGAMPIISANGVEISEGHPLYDYVPLLLKSNGDTTQLLNELKSLRQIRLDSGRPENERTRARDRAIEFLEQNPKIKIDTSKVLYKATLFKGKTPDQYTLLEWDKPVSEATIEKVSEYAKEKYGEDNEFTEWLNARNRNPKLFKNDISGKRFYEEVITNKLYQLKSDKDVSLFLLEAGIDGIKYPAETIARGATGDTARGFNYVIFDENAISIEDVIKFQQDAIAARGAVMIEMDKNAIIYALTDPNVTTPLHELAHVFEHYLTPEERDTIIKSAGTTGWTTATSEYFARGFEKYLAEGVAPNNEMKKLFEKFKVWLAEIYTGLFGLDVELNDDMRRIYDTMLGVERTAEMEQFVEAYQEAEPAPIEESSDEQADVLAEAIEEGLSEDERSTVEGEAADKGISLRELIVGHIKNTIQDITDAVKAILDKYKEQARKIVLATAIAFSTVGGLQNIQLPTMKDVAVFYFQNAPTAVVRAISDLNILGDAQYSYDYLATKYGHDIIQEEEIEADLLVEEELAAMEEAQRKAQAESDAVIANREANTYSSYSKTPEGNLVYTNQYPATIGGNYILLKNKGGRAQDGTTEVEGVQGVAHFLLDHDPVTGESHPNNRRMHQIGRQNDYYVPVYTENGDGTVTVKYKRYSEVNAGETVMSPLRQFKFGDIDFASSQKAEGFKSAKEVVLRDGVTNPYTNGRGTYLIYTGSKASYGPFSGGSVVFIFTDKNGETFVREVSGSVQQIEAEGNKIARQYGIPPSEITIGYHDVGSFSRKPSADESGRLDTKQIDNMNTDPNVDQYTGGALLIPEEGTKRDNTQDQEQMPEPTREDAILNLINKLVDATSTSGKAFDATLGIPLAALNSSLKIIRAAYKAGKTLKQAIREGLKHLRGLGHKVDARKYEEYVVNKMTQKETKKEPPPKKDKNAPTQKETAKAKNAKVSRQNLYTLYSVFRKMYGLNRPRALAAAIIGDRMVGALARRNKLSKADMYKRISFTNAEQAVDAVIITSDGIAIINALTTTNVGKPLNDLARVFSHYLTKAEQKAILSWTGHSEWTDATSERFANGFLRFLANGNAPTRKLIEIFQQFRGWLTMAYNGLVGSEIDFELNDTMNGIYAKMIGANYNMKTRADVAVMGIAPTLFDANGKLLDAKQFEAVSKEFWRDLRRLRFAKAFKTYRSVMTPLLMKDSIIQKRVDWIKNLLSQLSTITVLMDGGRGTFFYDNIYRPLARATEASKKGKRKQQEILNKIANKIPGLKRGFEDIKRLLGKAPVIIQSIDYKKMPFPYSTMKDKPSFSLDRLMYIYALSKNADQRKRLAKMGIGKAALDEIAAALGPKLTAFADGVVEHLSNEYYKSINEVYKANTGKDLPKIENYFPVVTLTFAEGKSPIDANMSFEQSVNAEWQSALKDRTGKGGNINLNMNFSSLLVSHIDEMEHYKAFSKLVPDIDAILSTESVRVLAQALGVEGVLRETVLSDLNPKSVVPKIATGWEWIWNNFIRYTLNNKVVQLPRQGTSFLAAFAGYDGSLGSFLKDYAAVMLTFPKQIAKFRELSALYDERMRANLEGDAFRLATGQQAKINESLAERYYWLRKAKRKYDAYALSIFTTIGDSIGIAGYMARYHRDIRNGMSPEEALERYNEYDATQQPTSNTNRIPLQRSDKFGFARFIAPFSSAVFALMNLGYQGANGIYNSMRTGSPVRNNDVRKLVIGMLASNALFTLVNEFSKIVFGDDDEREDAMWELLEGVLGIGLLERIPFLGAVVTEAAFGIERLMGRKRVYNPFQKATLNPMEEVLRGLWTSAKNKDIERFMIMASGAFTGMNLDSYIGAYLFLTNLPEDMSIDMMNDENFYRAIGLAKTYRPKVKKVQGMSEAEWRRYFGTDSGFNIDKGPSQRELNPF